MLARCDRAQDHGQQNYRAAFIRRPSQQLITVGLGQIRKTLEVR
jgi:hypothetical protein